MSILLGNGNGSFAAQYGAGDGPTSLTRGDLNGDGKLDLVTANFNSNNVSILLGSGNGTLGTAVKYGVGTKPNTVISGDFNGDGKLDLAVTNSESHNVMPTRFWWTPALPQSTPTRPTWTRAR